MYIAIFDYLERVFAAVRPRKLLFMAVDGVAPRAKMNQQRSRRFRAAQEAQDREEEETRLREVWAKEGREVPPPKSGRPFDSNVITPGTPFMDRLALYLRTYTHHKLSSDPGWRGIKVILSDGSVPGEGEHKIMEYIRSQRNQPGYDPNTRHVIHGLDADLIMLSLATHEPHFSILREFVGTAQTKKQNVDLATQIEQEIKSRAEQEAEGKTSGGLPEHEMGHGAKNAAPTPFQFLHIAVLREYLHLEFADDCDYSCVGGFDLERVIDDFIFLCFFVGNDFLPHLPSLEIRLGAIDTLCDLYKTTFPKLGGHICDGGRVHIGRCKTFCVELGSLEEQLLQRHRQEEEKQKSKQRRREEETKNKETSKRHRDMLQRVAEIAAVPRASQHILSMRPDGKNAGASDAGSAARHAAYESALGRDAPLCMLYDQIKEFSEKPDDADSERLPTNLNGYQRAMAHQYCEELGVTSESRGSDPNREVWIVKKGDSANESAATKFKRELDKLIKTRNTFEQEEDQVMLGVPGWKDRYYKRKFEGVDAEGCKQVAHHYIEGLLWVMRYYFEGCNSWTWFFPHHYAPFAADIAEAIDPDVPIEFNLGKPFQPFEQLMGVLPPRSSHALPEVLAALMKDENSALADFYPPLNELKLDLNGKRFAWQAVVLLPFIDEDLLIAVTGKRQAKLSDDEKRRNSHGEPVLFVSKAHVAYKPIVTAYGPPPTPLELTEQLGALLFGRCDPLPDAPTPDKTLEPPEFRGLETDRALRPFKNYAVRIQFLMPPKDAVPSRPKLLTNVTMPRLTLTAYDKPVVKQGSFVSARGRGGMRGPGGGPGHGGPRPGYFRDPSDRHPVDEYRVNSMLEERVAARSMRDFGRADRLRNDLRAHFGVEVDDNQRSWYVARPAGSSSGSSPPEHSPPASPPLQLGSGMNAGTAAARNMLQGHGFNQHPPPGYQPGYQPPPGYQPGRGGPQPPPGPPPGGASGGVQRLPPSNQFFNPQQSFGGFGGPQPPRGPYPPPGPQPPRHEPMHLPSHLMPTGQEQRRAPPIQPFGTPFGGPGGGGPGGGGPGVAAGGGAMSQAASLLRQQTSGGPGAARGAPQPPGVPAASRPPPAAGASAELNKSAADLLRQQLKRPRE